MIYSTISDADHTEFENLLMQSQRALERDASNRQVHYLDLGGAKFEDELLNKMKDSARGTHFDNKIEKISGQKFPDIVAAKLYGVEVKTTTQNHWKSTGNSIFENTRVEGVEKIYLFFAKLYSGKPFSSIEFRWKNYSDCLYEIAVTHSPRYLIDMDTPSEKTIFSKINVSYDDFRKLSNPIQPIKEYYQKDLKPGEELWWMEQNSKNNISTMMKIQPWKAISFDHQENIRIQSMVLFPEIFGTENRTKYQQIPAWLVKYHSVVLPNVRDIFTAGGRQDIKIGQSTYKVPMIFKKLYDNTDKIMSFLETADADDLKRYWNIDSINKKQEAWLRLVEQYSSNQLNPLGLNVEMIFKR